MDRGKNNQEGFNAGFCGKTKKPGAHDRDLKNENGLQNLVAYYQKLFDIKENADLYSPSDYQNVKRSFVKYLLEKRAV